MYQIRYFLLKVSSFYSDFVFGNDHKCGRFQSFFSENIFLNSFSPFVFTFGLRLCNCICYISRYLHSTLCCFVCIHFLYVCVYFYFLHC